LDETITYTGTATEANDLPTLLPKTKEIPEVVECHFVSGKYACFKKVPNERVQKGLYEIHTH
jgi:Lrp/AsnC family transcriptional regulator for asnA, asnC and gidA